MTISSDSYAFARTIRITLLVHTFVVASMIDDQWLYYNLTRQAGGTWSRHLAPEGYLIYELYDSSTYDYTYHSIANDGTVRTHSGTITISADTALIIIDIGKDQILNEIRLVSPGGGVGREYVEGRFDELSSTLGWIWAFLCGFGIVMVGLLWIAPYLSKRGRYSRYDDAGRKRPKTSPPAARRTMSPRAKAERVEKEEREFGPRGPRS